MPLSIATTLKARALSPLLSLGAMPGMSRIPLSTIAMQLRAWRVVPDLWREAEFSLLVLSLIHVNETVINFKLIG